MPLNVVDAFSAVLLGKQLSLPHHVSVANSFLVRSGTLCPLPPLHAGILLGLNLWRPCACCPSLCESICVAVLLWLADAVLLESSITPFYSNISVSPFA